MYEKMVLYDIVKTNTKDIDLPIKAVVPNDPTFSTMMNVIIIQTLRIPMAHFFERD